MGFEKEKAEEARTGHNVGCRAGSSETAAAPGPNRPRREPFIPIRRSELIRRLADDAQLAARHREQFLGLCALLEAIFHFQYHRRLEAIKELYAPFNPDAATRELRPFGERELRRRAPELFAAFAELLERADYRRLSDDEIRQATAGASSWGVRLRIDFDAFERLEVFARGDVTQRRTRRRAERLYRSEEVDVPIYQRLVVIVHLRDDAAACAADGGRPIYLKIFKDVPKQDIDMLLPAARFQMTLLDRGKVLLPTLSGIALAVFKIVKGAFLVAFAGVYGLLAFLGLVGGTVGYGVKSFLGYLRTKERYQLSLTRNLYYQNLDNNAGVLYRVLDEAEEQECREAVLAYALLRRRAGRSGWTEQQLDDEAETYLRDLLGFPVDFEVGDALAKLQQLGCAERGRDGCWQAVPLDDALERLDAMWDRYFDYSTDASTP